MGRTVAAPGCCLVCGEALRPEDRYCEACGAEGTLDPPTAPTGGATCVRCGPSTLSAQGYCDTCGWLQPGPRDHVEIDLGVAAGVSDRGRRHYRNEDALALRVLDGDHGERMPVLIAVVCDGVSSAERPDDASEAAARAGADVLVAALLDGMDPESATRGP
ncbi:MAG: hypothetical protein ACRDZO_19695 [Egibacteraceae bacterium]